MGTRTPSRRPARPHPPGAGRPRSPRQTGRWPGPRTRGPRHRPFDRRLRAADRLGTAQRGRRTQRPAPRPWRDAARRRAARGAAPSRPGARPGPAWAGEGRRRTPRSCHRLGPEKGVAELLEAVTGWDRPLEVALAAAGFEDATGSQAALLDRCRSLAACHPNVRLRGALAWNEVLPWLAGAAAVIVPSHKETFGLVALEAMSVGTPVVAYRVGNLPALIEPTDHAEHLLVPLDAGPEALHKTAQTLLEDDILYAATTQTVYRRAADFTPHRIANLFLEAVS
nr:glycosyltransferase [Kitasatospora sp. Root107]